MKGIPIYSLYIHEYFLRHEVIQRAIYAMNLNSAISDMNQFYQKTGLGNDHKMIEQAPTGITIDGQFYPPQKE